MTHIRSYDQLIEEMKEKGIVFERGLTDEQLHTIGQLGGFTFPPDLADFLRCGVPIGRKRTAHDDEEEVDDRFPNWHVNPEGILKTALRRTLGNFYFDVLNNNFWMDDWGECPLSFL